jgi:Domain of unknown function (DUF397)
MKYDLSRAQWRKSSYSGNTGNCVEIADLGDSIAARDSKDPHGPVLIFARNNWQSFVLGMKLRSYISSTRGHSRQPGRFSLARVFRASAMHNGVYGQVGDPGRLAYSAALRACGHPVGVRRVTGPGCTALRSGAVTLPA